MSISWMAYIYFFKKDVVISRYLCFWWKPVPGSSSRPVRDHVLKFEYTLWFVHLCMWQIRILCSQTWSCPHARWTPRRSVTPALCSLLSTLKPVQARTTATRGLLVALVARNSRSDFWSHSWSYDDWHTHAPNQSAEPTLTRPKPYNQFIFTKKKYPLVLIKKKI